MSLLWSRQRWIRDYGPFNALVNEADARLESGHHVLAESMLRRALAMARNVGRPAYVADIEERLAEVLLYSGAWEEAHGLAACSLAFRGRTDEKGPALARNLLLHAECGVPAGRYLDVIENVRWALAISEEHCGPTTVESGVAHLMLSRAMDLPRRYMPTPPDLRKEALHHARRATQVLGDVLGLRNHLTAEAYVGLAQAQHQMGSARAESTLELALKMFELDLADCPAMLSAMFIAVANTFHEVSDRWPCCLTLHERALALCPPVETNPGHALVLHQSLGVTCSKTHRDAEAREHFLAALGCQEQLITKIVGIGHPSTRAAALEARGDLHFSILRCGTGARADVELALISSTLFKARAIDLCAAAVAAPGIFFERPRSARTRAAQRAVAALAAYLVKCLGTDLPAESLNRIDELRAKIDEFLRPSDERALDGAYVTRPLSPATVLERLASRLPPGGAFVDFVTLPGCIPMPLRLKMRLSEFGMSSTLAAIILRHDGDLRLVELGSSGEIEEALAGWKGDAFRPARGASREVEPPPRVDRARRRTAARTLYEATFVRLEPALEGITEIWVAPEGRLARVPFHALHDGKAFLMDRFAFHYVLSGRDLLPEPPAPPSEGVVVVAAPDFGPTLLSNGPRSSAVPGGQLRAALGMLTPLPGAEREARAISQVFPGAEVWTGRDATEGRVLDVAGPAVLHLATHGFHIPSRSSDGKGGARYSGLYDPRSDPLYRSVIALASAASRSQGATTDEHVDGLVTAAELALTDLVGTKVVVLSGCETAVGEERIAAGVLGLRDAARMAGAGCVISSLWSVDDEATADFMTELYDGLAHRYTIDEATRRAMLAVRQTRPDPYYWAPFVALGRADTSIIGVRV